MREALRRIDTINMTHAGLAYDVWAPHPTKQKDEWRLDPRAASEWLSNITNIKAPEDYVLAFDCWRNSFQQPVDRLFEMSLVSRLLVGQGNGSATGIGLTVHHTWGVPIIPGTAVKGLVAHYVDAVYGPEDPVANPTGDRARYQGVTWDEGGSRIIRGPGDWYRTMFGAPDVLDDQNARGGEDMAGATVGSVIFHDALYIPGTASQGHPDRPYAVDVLTVHQGEYYKHRGLPDGTWPNDYDAPNPVSFLTVRPGARFLFALSGPPDWTEVAGRILVDALQHWGIGGKTSAGYGRFVLADANGMKGEARSDNNAPVMNRPLVARYHRGDFIEVVRVEDPKGKVKFRASDGLLGHFAGGENPPPTEIGESTNVWVANSNESTYTLTLRDPTAKKGWPKKGGGVR